MVFNLFSPILFSSGEQIFLHKLELWYFFSLFNTVLFSFVNRISHCKYILGLDIFKMVIPHHQQANIVHMGTSCEFIEKLWHFGDCSKNGKQGCVILVEGTLLNEWVIDWVKLSEM